MSTAGRANVGGIMPQITECDSCGEPIYGEPLKVPTSDGYEYLLCCSVECSDILQDSGGAS